ncbi:MAG: ABC transporter permease, partial [Chitinophagales bacterium]
LLTILLPIVLITLFAFAFGAVGVEKNEPTPIIVLYYDGDNTSVTKQIIVELDSIPGIQLERVEIEKGTSLIQTGDRLAQIIFYSGFQDSLNNNNTLPVELRYDKSREMEISILQSVLINKFAKLQGSANAAKGIDAIIKSAYPNITDSAKNRIASQYAEKQLFNSDTLLKMTSIVGDETINWGLIQAVAGTAIMMLLFSVSAMGGAIIDEKENGVLKKLLQSPIAPFHILTGKMVSVFIIAFAQLAIMFIYSWLAFGLDIITYLIPVLILIIATAFTCTAFGMLLASIAASKRQADALRTIIILFMSAIGGSMIPLYIMPSFMQDIAVISVNYWSIQGFYDIFWRQTGIRGIMDNIITLLGIAIILFIISYYFFKRNILNVI